jgi:AraC family transcriptional activator of pobA
LSYYVMKNYRPLLFEDIDLRVAGLRVNCLRLNSHNPEAKPEPHSHDAHGQILIYLSGAGWQEIEGERMAARAGTVIYVAPGQWHAFERGRARRPLCLVLDLQLDEARPVGSSIAQLNAAELTQIRGRVSGLFARREADSGAIVLQLGAVILDVLDPVMAAFGWAGAKRVPAQRKTITRKVERALTAAYDSEESLREMAERMGYQQDYLNRLLKAECGLTLGQLQRKMRLEQAQRSLRDRELSISQVAEQVGMLDNNYFARWFKQQTGMTPSAWRKGTIMGNP